MVVRRSLMILAIFAFAACTRATPPEQTSPPPTGPGQVKGSVTARDTGDPLAQVSISFYSDDGQIVGNSAFTDARGNFAIELPPGKYRVLTNSATESKPLGWNGYAPVWTNGELSDLKDERYEVRSGQGNKYDVILPRVWPSQGKVSAPSGAIQSGNVTAVKFRDGATFASIPLPSDGNYTFPLPDGEWQIQVDAPGFNQSVSTKFVVAGAPASIPPIALSAS